MREAVALALRLGEAQLERISVGDLDGYLAGLDEYGAACRELEADAGRGDRGPLQRLLTIDRTMNALLQEAKDGAGRKLTTLAQGRVANSAYLAGATAARRAPLFEA